MLKEKLRKLVAINTILIIGLIAFFAYKTVVNTTKIVCVDNIKLFDGFNMTKEMKRLGEKEFNVRKTTLDNLYSKLQSGNVSESEKKGLMQQFISGREELDKFNQRFASEEASKIWSRIHSYTIEYSKEKNYQLIIGSENKRTVLAASEEADVTTDLINFINKKYEGLK